MGIRMMGTTRGPNSEPPPLIPITRSSEYTIRALTHLARSGEGTFLLARNMAEELGIPAPFLGKCLQPLVACGILESQRGRGGGFRLLFPPHEVTLYQIVDAQEHLDRGRRCVLGQAECSDERGCPLHEYWKATSGDFLDLLQNTSLADLIAFGDKHPSCGYPLDVPASEPSHAGLENEGGGDRVPGA